MRMPDLTKARFSVRQVGLSVLAAAAALALVLCAGAGCASTSQQTADTPGTTDTPSTKPSNQGTADTPADNPDKGDTSTDTSATDTTDTPDTSGTTTSATSAEAPVAQDKLISPAALNSAISADAKSYCLIDIRSYAEYSSGCIIGSVNIPSGKQFELRINEVPTDTRIVLISDPSYNGIEDVLATLQDTGHDLSRVYVLEGGINAWIKAGLPTEALMDYSC